ncbi:hypothetical protein BV394_13020 [Brevirhabdus pacifica]|uniref:Uncharacterized protein n=1 Tax=Brevirhabdus pacifica TaxID=1267768 RepID=A0A1U7DKL2_9RHOB|nr:hypothetical protein [Brevirhabdus pacifica]APX90530.1 hypothetical protein BV394_13020 [Brevirhabdus pacifica]OWU78463.1 hypothetical protein ATO5_06445 [Loktanella sp. 22II-4b]PJJ85350.1 hypothetical protein CLV77_2218 [Brevirhabdus pacifica]
MTDENPRPFNVLAVVQAGRLEYEAALFAVSFRAANPDFAGRLILAEPQPGPLWGDEDPRIQDPAVRTLLEDHGAEIRPFHSRHFGAAYPNGNKIEALSTLPAGEPFVFFDTDTLHLDSLSRVPFDFDRPSASMKRENTWPTQELYGPGYNQVWGALYEQFGLDFESSLDPAQPDEHWERYLYFNAGWFFHADPAAFGARFVEYATAIRDTPPPELVCQPLYPWLDQIALPLVIHSFGGGRATLPDGHLDGDTTCHWRVLPLAYAREADAVIDTLEAVTAPNRVKKVLKNYEPFKRMIFQGKGRKVREMFDRDALPRKEQQIRNRIKKARLWVR